jgi:aldose 1-epimerase
MNKHWIGAAVAAALGALLPLAAAEPQTKGGAAMRAGVQKSEFGQTADGQKVDLYTLANGRGMTAKVMTYGIGVTELHVPDARGQTADVVLGFDDLKGYQGQDNPYFGAVVGRVANRIAGGKFTLGGKTYTLAKNDKENSLHGGKGGFDKKVWKAQPITSPGGPAVRFTYRSPDGEEGYPGNLDVAVIVTLTNRDELQFTYGASTDKATPVNLSHHGYFNLAGHNADSILSHVVEIEADRYTPVDKNLIPTGELKLVDGTPFDFRKPTPVGARIRQVGGDPVGYDVNYVLFEGTDKTMVPPLAARVRDPKSGRVMEVLTTEPGIQFYTGNFLNGVKGKGGAVYQQYAGFCMEAQHFPDSVHQPNFPTTVLQPGETYQQATVYRFTAR